MELGRLFMELSKLGHEVEGVQIQKGNEVTVLLKFLDMSFGDFTPIIELAAVDELFMRGFTYEEIAKHVSDAVRKISVPISATTKRNYDTDKLNLILAASPEPLEDGVVYTKYLDVYLYMRHVNADGTNFKVRNETLKNWGVSASAAFNQAISNTKEKLMVHDGASIHGILPPVKYEDFKKFNKESMFGLSVSPYKYGAAVIAMTDVFAAIAKECNDDLWIVPMNVHQAMVLHKSKYELAHVKHVNEMFNMVFSKDSFLSDSIYMYSKAEGKLIIA